MAAAPCDIDPNDNKNAPQEISPYPGKTILDLLRKRRDQPQKPI